MFNLYGSQNDPNQYAINPALIPDGMNNQGQPAPDASSTISHPMYEMNPMNQPNPIASMNSKNKKIPDKTPSYSQIISQEYGSHQSTGDMFRDKVINPASADLLAYAFGGRRGLAHNVEVQDEQSKMLQQNEMQRQRQMEQDPANKWAYQNMLAQRAANPMMQQNPLNDFNQGLVERQRLDEIKGIGTPTEAFMHLHDDPVELQKYQDHMQAIYNIQNQAKLNATLPLEKEKSKHDLEKASLPETTTIEPPPLGWAASHWNDLVGPDSFFAAKNAPAKVTTKVRYVPGSGASQPKEAAQGKPDPRLPSLISNLQKFKAQGNAVPSTSIDKLRAMGATDEQIKAAGLI